MAGGRRLSPGYRNAGVGAAEKNICSEAGASAGTCPTECEDPEAAPAGLGKNLHPAQWRRRFSGPRQPSGPRSAASSCLGKHASACVGKAGWMFACSRTRTPFGAAPVCATRLKAVRGTLSSSCEADLRRLAAVCLPPNCQGHGRKSRRLHTRPGARTKALVRPFETSPIVPHIVGSGGRNPVISRRALLRQAVSRLNPA